MMESHWNEMSIRDLQSHFKKSLAKLQVAMETRNKDNDVMYTRLMPENINATNA